MESALVPFLYVEHVLRSRHSRGTHRHASGIKSRRIPEDHWPEIEDRMERESLRSMARDFGVSQEIVRAVLRVTGPAGQPR